MAEKLTTEEREILDGFERDELSSATGAPRELEEARQAARIGEGLDVPPGLPRRSLWRRLSVVAVFFEIALVVLLCPVESGGGSDLRDDGIGEPAGLRKALGGGFSRGSLFGAVKEHG